MNQNNHDWDIQFHFPDKLLDKLSEKLELLESLELSESNRLLIAQEKQLISGASPNARFIFDVIYSLESNAFVLTMMEINDEWGFIEHEKRLYIEQLDKLLNTIQSFQENPHLIFQD